ncbi:MAG: hypothetical protein LBD07_04780 [Spirochaetaceae bacterium]|jgi:hypothetical protein|nr:hypothetical protein [Spirochaetaceae bacterium]
MRRHYFAELFFVVFLFFFTVIVNAQDFDEAYGFLPSNTVPYKLLHENGRVETVYIIRPLPPPRPRQLPLPVERTYHGTPSRVIARYIMTVVEYYSVGNVLVPPANMIYSAQCSVFADGSIILRFYFVDNTYTDYRISKPVLKLRESPTLFKTTYSIVEKGGADTLLNPTTCDVYSNGYAICEITIHGRNSTSMTINLKKN